LVVKGDSVRVMGSKFATQVLEVGGGGRLVEEFLDDREEVMQGTNGIEWWVGRVTQ